MGQPHPFLSGPKVYSNLVALLEQDLAPNQAPSSKKCTYILYQMQPKGHILKAHFYPEPNVVKK